jgi:hypothetical protein
MRAARAQSQQLVHVDITKRLGKARARQRKLKEKQSHPMLWSNMENNPSLQKLSALAAELVVNGLQQQIWRDYIARLDKLQAEVSAILKAGQ